MQVNNIFIYVNVRLEEKKSDFPTMQTLEQKQLLLSNNVDIRIETKVIS